MRQRERQSSPPRDILYPMSPGLMMPWIQPIGGFTPWDEELEKLREQWIKGPRAVAQGGMEVR